MTYTQWHTHTYTYTHKHTHINIHTNTHNDISYTMKVLRQKKSFAASCSRRPSRKIFCGITHSFLLNPYLNSAILNFHSKSFTDMQKSTKTMKLFCLKIFMVYSTHTNTHMHMHKHTYNYTCIPQWPLHSYNPLMTSLCWRLWILLKGMYVVLLWDKLQLLALQNYTPKVVEFSSILKSATCQETFVWRKNSHRVTVKLEGLHTLTSSSYAIDWNASHSHNNFCAVSYSTLTFFMLHVLL